ncbi:hypothetical protein [Streptomyces sp. NPDC014995]|uniref:hypothetical protein n=1 Tax=Streptomyces sp. NPDC014995 TaxID=3364936 RepID=UPI0037001DF2
MGEYSFRLLQPERHVIVVVQLGAVGEETVRDGGQEGMATGGFLLGSACGGSLNGCLSFREENSFRGTSHWAAGV